MGEAPGHNEVREKHAFIGMSGDLLNRLFRHLGIERNEIIIGNALLCGPINDTDKQRPEFHDALVRCRQRREDEGDLDEVEVVLAAGAAAAEGLTGERVVLGGRQPRRGALHLDSKGRAIFPTWHPAALLRAGGDNTKGGKKAGGGLSDAEVEVLGFDLERSWQHAHGQRPAFKPVVLVTDRPATFVSWVQANAMRAARVAIDVETDSVDPTTANLLSVGLAMQTPKGETRAISFWWPAANSAAVEALRGLLAREGIEKDFHNLQFDVLVLERLVGPIAGPFFDTMLAMHAAFPECKLDLGSVSHTFLVVPPWKFLFREWERRNKKQVEARSPEWIRRLSEYNAMDAACTVADVEPLRVECEKRKVTQIADIDVQQALIARKMTERGLYVSPERRADLETNFREHEQNALAKLSKMVVEGVLDALRSGMHLPEVEKLLAEIQKSSNKSLPKPRVKKIKAKKPKKRRKKKGAQAAAAPEQMSLAAVAVVVQAPVAAPPLESLPVTLESSNLPGVPSSAETPSAEQGSGSMVLSMSVGDSPQSATTPPVEEAPREVVVYPPIPDKVWLNKAWNPLSTTQLRLAFDICGVQLPANALTKKGQRSLSKHVLVQVFDHPLVGAVIEARKYRRLLSVYFESEGAKVAEDHRLRVGWKVHGTPTGRWSSGAGGGGVGDIGIAVQNWPPIMRRMIVAPPGYLLVGADYAQLEFRMIALLSGETTLLDVFNDSTGGRDLHSENAARLYGHVWMECDPTGVIDPIHSGRLDAKQVKAIMKLHDKNVPLPEIAEQFGWSEAGLQQVIEFAGRRVLIRKFTKTGLYAAVYGAVPPTVQSQLRAQSLKETDPKFARMLREVSLKQCQTFVDVVPRFWPKLSRWREEQISIRQKTGIWICPWSGRRRVWPMGRVDPTQCVNTPVQGASGSLMNDRFVTLGGLLPPDVHIILQVHDSVTLEAPQEIALDVKQLVEKTMTATLEYNGHSCLFPVEAAVGPSWDVV